MGGRGRMGSMVGERGIKDRLWCILLFFCPFGPALYSATQWLPRELLGGWSVELVSVRV